MTHKLLAGVSIAVLALSVVSACAQDDAAATAAEEMETGPGSTVVESLLNSPPQFVPSTTDERRPIYL
jgi:hypothetical protein